MKMLFEDAVALLDLLGWEDVGALLLSHGITDGVQEDSVRCPVALFLRKLTGKRVIVDPHRAGWYPFLPPRRAKLPEAAREFVRMFDTGWDVCDHWPTREHP
jgi:hypothetical protein